MNKITDSLWASRSSSDWGRDQLVEVRRSNNRCSPALESRDYTITLRLNYHRSSPRLEMSSTAKHIRFLLNAINFPMIVLLRKL